MRFHCYMIEPAPVTSKHVLVKQRAIASGSDCVGPTAASHFEVHSRCKAKTCNSQAKPKQTEFHYKAGVFTPCFGDTFLLYMHRLAVSPCRAFDERCVVVIVRFSVYNLFFSKRINANFETNKTVKNSQNTSSVNGSIGAPRTRVDILSTNLPKTVGTLDRDCSFWLELQRAVRCMAVRDRELLVRVVLHQVEKYVWLCLSLLSSSFYYY